MLGVITLIAGAALSGVFSMTKDAIEEQKLLAATESYKEVVPEAETFEMDEAVTQAIADMEQPPAFRIFRTRKMKTMINNFHLLEVELMNF